MEINISNIEQKIVGQVKLHEEIFGLPIREDILHRVIEWQRSKARSGTHKTKTISEISGTTKKPYKQKGTGSARQGSMRSGQFRGGSTIFGPVVRTHEYSLPKKVRKLGLKIALSLKFNQNKLFILEKLEFDNHKTSNLIQYVKDVDFKKILIIGGDEISFNVKKASANIKNLNVLPQIGANVYDILKHECLILTSDAVDRLTERLK